MKRTLGLAILCIVAGCGGQLRPADGETVAADTATTPTLSFAADWSITQSVPLVGGASATIHYDPARLPKCRASAEGFPAWAIGAYYAVDGGQAFSVPVTQFTGGAVVAVDATFIVPPGEDLAVWFHASDDGGCEQWDSNYGNNFHFAVASAPTLRFSWPGWSFAQSAPLGGGASFLVDYDIRRLPYCRGTEPNGVQTWDVVVDYQFDGGAAATASLTTVSENVRTQVPASIVAPSGASTVSVWFENFDSGGCQGWDSAYGANYHFALVR
ncbi:MAG TPA: DUF6209 family protein [Gemmatimonadaceae bacterium]|nr:DUF6209 family protein [Gemmatimonadaceae bacterium]